MSFGKHPADKQAQPPQKPVKFTPGRNIIVDADVRVFGDLARFYPLPVGFIYRQETDGVPVVVRLADRLSFAFIIEEDLLTFEVQRADGRGTITVEVFKRA